MGTQPVVLRTARVALRLTDGQRRRCFELLRASGDVWAGLIEFNQVRFARGGKPVFGFTELCRELTGADLGPLARICAEDLAKGYSHACFETAARKKAGQRARYPRKKRGLYPTRFRWGAFTLDGDRLRLAVAKGRPELWVRLSRAVPYPAESVRSVTLVAEAGRLFVDVTAAVPVEDHGCFKQVTEIDSASSSTAVTRSDGLGLVVWDVMPNPQAGWGRAERGVQRWEVDYG